LQEACRCGKAARCFRPTRPTAACIHPCTYRLAEMARSALVSRPQARGGHRNHLARLAQGCQLLLLHQRVPAPEKGKVSCHAMDAEEWRALRGVGRVKV
jgi:hypothetical protein